MTGAREQAPGVSDGTQMLQPVRSEWQQDHKHRSRRGLGRWFFTDPWDMVERQTLVAPSQEELQQTVGRNSGAPWWVAEALTEYAPETLDHAPVMVMPRIVPHYFYPPGDGADVFGVTRRFHLEDRPRLVSLATSYSGAALSRLILLADRLLSGGGELVLVDGIRIRADLAPVLNKRGLAERVVFLPHLTDAELAGLFLSSDVILLADGDRVPRTTATWGMATGTPVVARHSPANQAVLGTAALWVYDDTMESWQAAMQTALEKDAVREELAQRALNITQGWRAQKSVPIWVQAIDAMRQPDHR